MILASLLSISINLLLVIFVAVCLLMTLLILMQRPKQEGLGAAFGGGVTDQVFGARTTNVLQRGTIWLGSLFFIISLTLAILIGKQNKSESLLSPVAKEEAAATPAEETPQAEETESSSLADELPGETPAPVVIPEEEIPAEDTAETPPEEAPVQEETSAEQDEPASQEETENTEEP